MMKMILALITLLGAQVAVAAIITDDKTLAGAGTMAFVGGLLAYFGELFRDLAQDLEERK